MALNWTNKQDGVDFISAEDVNSLAKAIMDNERNINDIKIKPNIEIDDELSSTSTNPVQNKVITAELKKKANKELAFDGIYYFEDTPFGGEGAVEDDLKSIQREGIHKIFFNYSGDYIIGILKIGSYDVEGINGTYQTFIDMNNNVYTRYSDSGEGWEKISVSQSDLDNAIGDIETSLENIIKKYGLGGESV